MWKRSGEGDGRGDLCEVIKFSDEPRSWFVDNSIQSGERGKEGGWKGERERERSNDLSDAFFVDGSLFLCTPIDPLFLALPYLMKTKVSLN